MLQNIFPGFAWLQGYGRSEFRSDLISGVTIAFMLIPQGMAYAVVAGLLPEYGLYACILPPIIYALLGTSNKISIGPVALDSILIFTGLSLLAEPGSDQYLKLAIALTLMVGVIQTLFGFIKLGFIANFLSYPVILGYTSAAALIIIGSQLDNMVGMDRVGGNIFQQLYQIALGFEYWNLVTLVIGLLGVGVMLLPRLFPGLPLPYALILLVAGMFFSGLFNAQGYRVDVIDYIPQGLPSPELPSLSMPEFFRLFQVALTVALMGYIGTMSICKSLEKPTDKITAQPNQELVAVGVANLFGSIFKAFPVSASFSRSAAFRQSGALTQVSAIVSSICILFIVLFFTPFFIGYPLPKALLSAIIIVSVASLFKYRQIMAMFSESRREFAVLMVTFSVTLLLGVQQGLLLGIVLSISMVIYNTAKPHMTELGAINKGELYRNITRFKEAEIREDVLIFRFDAPLYFANKDYFVERLYAWVKRRKGNQLKYIVFDAEAVNSVDCTAMMMLQQLIENFSSQGIKFIITNPIGPVRDVIKNSSMQDYMCEESVFATINDAIVYIDQGINMHAQSALQTNT